MKSQHNTDTRWYHDDDDDNHDGDDDTHDDDDDNYDCGGGLYHMNIMTQVIR